MATDLFGYQAEVRSQLVVSMFLSVYEGLDQRVMPNRTKPIWIEKYNMLGLLRAPGHFSRFRLVRNLYEGGHIGEGAVRELRQLCPTGVRAGWSRNMLEKYYRNRNMKTLYREALQGPPGLILGNTEHVRNTRRDRDASLRKYRRYQGIVQLKQYLLTGNTMSTIVCRDPNNGDYIFGCCTKNKQDGWQLHRIEPLGLGHISDTDGFVYYHINLLEPPTNCTNQIEPVFEGCLFHGYGIMLPYLWKTTEPDEYFMYAFMGEQWEHLKPAEISQHSFSKYVLDTSVNHL